MFLLNTANSSLNGRWLWENPEKSPVKFGVDLGAKAANGALSLFESVENAREFTGNVFMSLPFGGSEENSGNNLTPKQQVMLDFSICRGTYNFVKSDMSAATGQQASDMSGLVDKTDTKTRMLPSMFLYYNRTFMNNVLAGVSVGYARQNNYASLETRQLVDTRPVAPAQPKTSTGKETSIILSQLIAREGDYKEFNALKVNVDLLYAPGIEPHNVGLSLFFRYTYRHSEESLFEPGFGIFNLKESTPPKKETGDESQNRTGTGDSYMVSDQSDSQVSADRQARNESPLGKGESPWKIVYGFVVQWDDMVDECRVGFVAGYNF